MQEKKYLGSAQEVSQAKHNQVRIKERIQSAGPQMIQNKRGQQQIKVFFPLVDCIQQLTTDKKA